MRSSTRTEPSPPRADADAGSRRSAAGLAVLALVLLGWFLWPFVGGGARYPVGPDGPVYLWWSRLADLEGLSVVGHRPGASALGLVLQGTGLSVVQVTAALEVALGVSVGLAGTALLRRRASGVAPWLGGLLAGTFAVHLAAGYLANLAFVPCFLVAIVLLDEDRRSATVLAALALGASGLEHPLFFLLGGLVLAIAAATSVRSEPAAARRVAGALLGGGVVVGGGLLALLIGPRPLEVDTSKDAFLRRAGLDAELRDAYRERLLLRWPRYVPWLSVPLAVLGMSRADGLSGRVLRAWLWVTLGGVVIAFATAWLPADRFITVGFAIPLLAALGIERVRERLARRRVLSWASVAVLTGLLLAGPAIVWNRQEPFISEDQVRATAIAMSLGPVVGSDGPIAFLVDDADGEVTFLASQAGNVIRASVPPERIRDVVVLVPEHLGASGLCDGGCQAVVDDARRALQDITAADLRVAEATAGRDALTVVVPSFFEGYVPQDAIVVDPRLLSGDPLDALPPSSASGMALASLVVLLLLWGAGYGWARIGLGDRATALAAGPALGTVALTLVAVALDLLGVRIGSTVGALAALALAGGGGYVAWFFLERRPGAGPAPQVEQQPPE